MNIDVLFDINVKTPLCEIMERYGSDKGTTKDHGHHNYSIFYHALFSSVRNENLNIFELGLGTNNTSIPCNMGSGGKPGASLYGWREYFPRANIYGADIDAKILFDSERIKTYFCDQTNPHITGAMWSTIDKSFDIIIDDGLHDFEANKIFFENSYQKLKIGGVFIIEDIHFGTNLENMEKQLKIWESELPNFTFKIIRIDGANKFDNNIVVIKRNY
jgi:hypothetical protein